MAFIELRDRYNYQKRMVANNDGVTPHEAQLVAMLENAKSSSWQQNLRNAADAQDRFMLPGQELTGGMVHQNS